MNSILKKLKLWINNRVIPIRSFAQKVLKVSLIVTILSIVLGLYYLANQQIKSKSDWLVTQHFDPRNAGWLTNGSKDGWPFITANENFVNLPESERINIAIKKSQEVWKYAEGQGYKKKEFENWFKFTAQKVAEFPLKEEKLSYGKVIVFRDFSNTNPPKQTPFEYFKNTLLNRETLKLWPYFLIYFSFIYVISFILGGAFQILFTKDFSLIIKLTLIGILLLTGLSFRFYSNAKKVYPSAILYVDIIGETVIAKGSWKGLNQKLAYPINVADITCNKKDAVCREADAQYDEKGSSFFVSTSVWDITEWSEKEVIVESEAECATTKMIINYQSNSVTQIRNPKNPLPVNCIATEKFVIELVSGSDVYFNNR